MFEQMEILEYIYEGVVVLHTSTERTEHIQTIITSAQDTDNVLPDKLCIWLIDKLYSE